jgi:hypothetical protein
MNIRVTSMVTAALYGLLGLAGCAPPPPGGTSRQGGGRAFEFPATGVAVERQAMLLAIDEISLPLRENVNIYLSKPSVRKEPVLRPSRENPKAPDSVAAHFYGTVLHDGPKFRMWYYACWLKNAGDPSKADLKELRQGPVCYAESDDGIVWTKPNLGQVEIHGSKANNAILLPDESIETVSLIKEESDPNPERRYKMVYNGHNGKTWVIRTATSADGLHWKGAPDYAIDQFIETSSFYRFNGLYVTNGQRITLSEGGNAEGRQGRALVSVDFDRWLPGHTDAFLLQEPLDPAQRGTLKPYDQVHLGVGGAPFGNVVVGLYGLWHNMSGDESQKGRWGWFGYARTSADLGLLVSNDGLHFREPVKGHVYLSRHEAAATPVPGKNYPTVLCQSGNGILNVGNETRIYHGRWLNAEYGMGYLGEVGLATLPRDRWGALGLHPAGSKPFQPTGSVWSTPIRLPEGGAKVVLNADGADHMAVEVSDASFQLLPEYSGDRAGKSAEAKGLDCAVAFPAGSLAALGGKTVRFKVNMKKGETSDPRLYAVYLRTE